MNSLVLVMAVFLTVPAARAQQADTDQIALPVAQESTTTTFQESGLPDELKPGHPLDPADVDILTGKRDRELEIARRANSLALGGYGAYGNYTGIYAMTDRRGAGLDFSRLPLRGFTNSFFLFGLQTPRGFGQRRFR
jgi:hypothetical protein